MQQEKISLFVLKTPLNGKSSPLNTTATTQSWCWLSCRPPVHLLTFSRRKNPRRSCSGLTASHTWSPTSTVAAGGHGVGAQRHLALGNYTGLSFSCAITWQKWAQVFTWLLHRSKPYTTWLEEWRSPRTRASNAFANHRGNALLAPVTAGDWHCCRSAGARGTTDMDNPQVYCHVWESSQVLLLPYGCPQDVPFLLAVSPTPALPGLHQGSLQGCPPSHPYQPCLKHQGEVRSQAGTGRFELFCLPPASLCQEGTNPALTQGTRHQRLKSQHRRAPGSFVTTPS